MSYLEKGIQTVFFERGALAFNIVDRVARNQLATVSRWRDRIPVVVRPLAAWQVREEPR
jgi:hypothetical protein